MSDAPLSQLPVDANEPYIGLKPYTAAERDRFFGRERDAQLLINKLFSHPLTLLYAPSGVGKTSLLRALVIPNLKAEEAQVVYFDRWNTADPCSSLAAVIRQDEAVTPGPGQLVDAAQAALARDDSTLVIVLDQFEEYLQRYAANLGLLPAALGALLRTTMDVRVVLSFREEFLASVDACLRGHVLALFASTYHLEHLDRERAREAIVFPARKYGGTCDEELVDRLLDDLAPGDPEKATGRLFRGGIELPFLQLICRSLWERGRAAGHSGMRMDDYRALGGRKGIISAYLHTVTRDFGLFQRLDAAQVLKALAPRSGVKIAYPLEALAAQAGTSEPRTQKVLDILREHRIVRTRDAAGGVSYELQHDAFIEIVRPWAEACFKRRNRLIGGGVACAVLLATALNVAMLNRDRSEAEARRQAAEVSERIDVDARRALEKALALAGGSEDHAVRMTLRQAVATFLQSPALPPHPGGAVAAGFSRDGRWIFSAGEDGEARLIEARSLALQARVPHSGALTAMAASADGSRLVSAGRDGVLQVWDRSGRILTRCGHPGGPAWTDVDISRDGKRIVAIRESEDGMTPDLLLTPAGAVCQLTRLSGHFGNVASASFDESGDRVLSFGNNDNTARVWDAGLGSLLATLTHPDEVLSASFSPDGKEIAVAVADGSVYRWTPWGRLLGRPLELPPPVRADLPPALATAARHAPDGLLLAVASSDGGVYLWTLQPGEEKPVDGPVMLPGNRAGAALAVSFSPDGRRILSFGTDDTLRLWEAPFSFQPREFRGHSAAVRNAVFSPDGTRLLSAGADGVVRLWRIPVTDLLTPQGNGLVLSADRRHSFRTATGQLLGGEDDAPPRKLIKAGESVRVAVFSPDGHWLALGMHSGRLRVVSLVEGEASFEFDDTASPIAALAFDLQGRRLAVGGTDGHLRFYDVATPKADPRGLLAHTGPVVSVDVAPDGAYIISTGADGAARVWDWQRQALSTLEGGADRVRDARFSSDGKRILRRNGDRITTFDAEVWARSDAELIDFARGLLGKPAAP